MILQSELNQILQDIVNNPLFGILGFLLAIISVSLAILFYFTNKREKKPRYEVISENVVQDLSHYDGLEILYDKQLIKNLTVTNIKFTNEGKMTIHKTDIATADPILIKIDENFQILEVEVVETENIANQFSIDVNSDKSSIVLKFDYLDHKEGGKVKILHTGKDNNDFIISGSVKGAGKIEEKEKPLFDRYFYLLSAVLGMFSGIIISILTNQLGPLGSIIAISLLMIVIVSTGAIVYLVYYKFFSKFR